MKHNSTPKGYSVQVVSGHTDELYRLVGRLITNRQVIKELEGPVFDDKSYTWLIAMHGKTVAGFSSFSVDEQKATFGVTYILPEHRRKSLYRHLFGLKEQMCFEQRPVVVGLANPISQPLFDENNWTIVRKNGKWTHYRKERND